ncbi:MAG: DUF308 domain-containing protein [Nitrosopumilus sp.]|nr:DUF308 domain-containing protein [Nitrosopumilus sp.]
MVDKLTCTECGSNLSSNLSFCPNCKCNVESNESKKPNGFKKITQSNAYGVLLVIIGIMILFGGQWYHYLLSIVAIVLGIHTFYKNFKKKNHEKTRQF